ncbi:GrpB-like predicted nucleotidyltransferase (UPF0157 family) [Haloactinospora alba]|uniref:GrpB-like predicted nucleotidyltransferase (UPF0157 family) n=1 Tax=Haloactinospora alba TaxID=405555 RepID=A0A543NL89_9ACTN|nr:GrpB-like predicted nucleotidyltransferase (UPF0157 family) [Haloactinospora alba]
MSHPRWDDTDSVFEPVRVAPVERGSKARVDLVSHDEDWHRVFASTADRLRPLPGVCSVEHVGSTSVRSIPAKPVIDINLAVNAIRTSEVTERLNELGFQLILLEPDWHEHWLFKRRAPATNLHVLPAGCSVLARDRAFRDLLTADRELADEYARLKRTLAHREWGSAQEYAEAKTEFIIGSLRCSGFDATCSTGRRCPTLIHGRSAPPADHRGQPRGETPAHDLPQLLLRKAATAPAREGNAPAPDAHVGDRHGDAPRELVSLPGSRPGRPVRPDGRPLR